MDIRDRYKGINDDIDPQNPEEGEAGNAFMYVAFAFIAIFSLAIYLNG